MLQYFIEFRAEYYCQGLEWATFQRLVRANSFAEACNKIKYLDTGDWEYETPKDFKNLSI